MIVEGMRSLGRFEQMLSAPDTSSRTTASLPTNLKRHLCIGRSDYLSVCDSVIQLSQELGNIRFDFDSDGPSQIQAWIPTVNQGGIATTWQPDTEEGSIEASVERNETNRSPVPLCLSSAPPPTDSSR
jgi:hypothetical protein